MERLRANSMAWLERTNPLRGLSISRAGAIFDNARVWGSPRLQYMYNEIEMTDPVLMTCVERRNAALAGLQQQFVAIAGTDSVLADEQRDALARFANGIDNFGDTLERMDEAFFRGYCHVQPIWDGATVPHVNFLNSWNFMRDGAGRWLWNPKCHETIAGLDDVRGARLVSLVRRRAIDYPAIFIYIRKALGERDYGRFIERHGIPHAAIMMAPGTEKKDVPAYLAAADAWNNGQNMVLPNGATTDLATEARGTDPFTPFVEHQDKYIVLLATGGTLTSLAQADTGSLAGGAQMEVWREIVARDGVLIADALNRGLFRRYLEMAFPGRPVCAEFRLDNEKKASAEEVADLAGKLKVAGWRIDQGQLEEAVGYTLERDDGGQGLTALPNGALGDRPLPSTVGRGVPSAPLMNKEKDLPAPAGQSEAAGQRQQGQDAGNSSEDVLKAFARDTGPAADAIKALLNNPSKEAAEAILADLPSLLPEDPALAAVIAEEMAKQFTVDGEGRAPSRPLEKESNAITNPCPKCHHQMTKEGTCTHCEKVAANRAVIDGLVADLDRVTAEGGKKWKNTPKELGEIDDKLADDIKKANPDMKATVGTMQTIDQDQLRHAIMEHGEGKEKLPTNVPITKDDLKRIPDVLNDYDEIVRGKGIRDGKKQEGVVFRKKFDDGTVCCVEIDWYRRGDKRHELKFQTMWKERGEGK